MEEVGWFPIYGLYDIFIKIPTFVAKYLYSQFIDLQKATVKPNPVITMTSPSKSLTFSFTLKGSNYIRDTSMTLRTPSLESMYNEQLEFHLKA